MANGMLISRCILQSSETTTWNTFFILPWNLTVLNCLNVVVFQPILFASVAQLTQKQQKQASPFCCYGNSKMKASFVCKFPFDVPMIFALSLDRVRKYRWSPTFDHFSYKVWKCGSWIIIGRYIYTLGDNMPVFNAFVLRFNKKIEGVSS